MKPSQKQTEQPVRQVSTRLNWLPRLKREIWILAAGQLLLYLGQGFTLVYASIYFVNELGFSPTQVGLALSSSGLSGMVGRFWAGNAVESERFGRRGTLLLSAAIASAACFCLAFAETFPWLVTGNLLLGLGFSLYWPPTLAVTTDLTTTENRTEAFAVTRLADNLGLGLGALLAGQYLAMSGSYRALFIGKGVTYLLFGIVIYITIAETRKPQTQPRNLRKDWWQALSDRFLVAFLIANLFFTTYESQLSSTLPLYLANFIPAGNGEIGFSEQWISYFFVWHAALKIVLQLPITRKLKPLNHITVLLISLVLWSGGFLLLWVTGITPANAWIFALGAFSSIALAEILFAPTGVALVGNMAPVRLRGIYFSLESECWAIGFTIGPTLGGWALDRPDAIGANVWLILMLSAGISGAILMSLKSRMTAATETDESWSVKES